MSHDTGQRWLPSDADVSELKQRVNALEAEVRELRGLLTPLDYGSLPARGVHWEARTAGEFVFCRCGERRKKDEGWRTMDVCPGWPSERFRP